MVSTVAWRMVLTVLFKDVGTFSVQFLYVHNFNGINLLYVVCSKFSERE